MPVSAQALKAAGLEYFLRFMHESSDAVHILIGPETKLWFLSDIIPLAPLKKVISLGDVFVILAVILFFPETTMLAKHKRRLNGDNPFKT